MLKPDLGLIGLPTAVLTASSLQFPFGTVGARGICQRIDDPDSPIGGGGSAAPAVDPFRANVWTQENLVSGFGRTQTVSLTGLPAGATELSGKWAKIKGLTALNGNFFHNPLASTSSLVTADAFDQVQAYYAITMMAEHLNSLGFDMAKVIKAMMPVVVNVNAVDDLNAWFDPSTGELTFGTSKHSPRGPWHLASDHDIVWHEFGHLILHNIVPALSSWYAKDGGAIHEGFADGLASLYKNDSQLSEDFSPQVGSVYGTELGLRDVNNLLKYGDVDAEVHARGQIYGGFWWGVKTAIQGLLGGNARQAADLTAGIMVQHASHYATNSPLPKDFLIASQAGMKTYLQGRNVAGITPEAIADIMIKQAVLRAMVPAGTKLEDPTKSDSSELAKIILHLASKDLTFTTRNQARGTFVGRDFLQQYLLANGNVIRMVGSGLIVFTTPDGEYTSHSEQDLLREASVDTTEKIGARAALNRVVKAAIARLFEIDALIDGTNAANMSEEDKTSKLDELQMKRRKIYLAAEKAKEVAGVNPWEATELVAFPQGTNVGTAREKLDMYWRFPLAFDRFYVNARTGKVIVKEHPMW